MPDGDARRDMYIFAAVARVDTVYQLHAAENRRNVSPFSNREKHKIKSNARDDAHSRSLARARRAVSR